MLPCRERDPIAQVVMRLFPPGSEIVARPARSSTPGDFFILGGGSGPRWLIPAAARLAKPFLRLWRPYRLRSQSLWRAAMAGHRMGILSALPGVASLRIATPPGADWSHVGWQSDAPPVPVVHIARDGNARTAVAGLVDTQSIALRLVAKVSLGDGAGEAVLREAGILRRLAGERPGHGPRLLMVDNERKMLVQESIDGAPTGRRLTPAHIDWLARLVDPDQGGGWDLRCAELRRRLAAIGAATIVREPLSAAMDCLTGPALLPDTWTHGDFAPWNLKLTRQGKLIAVDWESARPQGLPLSDLVHFHSIQAQLFAGQWPLTDWRRRATPYLDKARIDRDELGRLTVAGLIDDTLGALERGVKERVDWLLEALAKTDPTAV